MRAKKKNKKKQANARKAHRPALSSPSEVITMLKGLKNTRTKSKARLNIERHVEKSKNHKATQNKNNTRITVLERSV